MDSDMMDEDSVFDVDDSGSDGFRPDPKPKMPPKKAASGAKATALKKMKQTTLKPKATTSKKRPMAGNDSDDDGLADDKSDMSHTPPSAKKQKKTATKKGGGKPLQELDNNEDGMDFENEAVLKSKKNMSDQYQKLTQLEHIIKRPDTYIGSTEMTESTMWVFNSDTEQMEYRKVNYVPGLYKIFDEILVNAADNKQNDPGMKQIKVHVNRDTGVISIENDGKGIPVEVHSKEKIYIPEMIFGHLLTSSNYDDDQAKTTGGRNGYGAKLCNIFSTSFTLETGDGANGKKYVQTWTDNMSKMGKAKITSSKANYTKVTFTPDWKKFGMQGIDDDFEALMKRRVYDMAGTVKGVKVSLNDKVIKVNNFKKYIEMYAKALNKERGLEPGADSSTTVIVDDSSAHPRWEIGFAVSDGGFNQVSFVNNIATTSGGTHVNHVADQICTKLAEIVKKKNPKGVQLKNNQIRNHIFLFINVLITNPAFNSQTKEQLTTKAAQFGSKCPLTDAFLKKIGQTDAVANILNFADKKLDQQMAKSDGNKRSRMNNAKLVDANLAGTKRGYECTLILTEGDSAKGLAVAGRAVLDPDRIGVFPLRGKLLNVRDAGVTQIANNAEIQNIKQFLGLKHKTEYTDCRNLRYGHLMIMADQDHDGSHIKGLLINFLQVTFPSLLKIPDFFREFITPIVKVWKGNPKKMNHVQTFFTMPEYERFKEAHQGEKGWEHKYYKGLGTSSNTDAQVYFKDLDRHLKEFQPMTSDEVDLFELAFSKKKSDARKQWLGDFVPGTFLDHSSKQITYGDFVNKELILFSMADNLRSIPSVLDGFKPGQRKVIYTCFKKNITKDKKVVELAGEVMGLTAYAHGDASMQGTITALAQNFVGSNNINCLEPSGNFGSRLAGGSDAASARYIYTRLSPFARRIFSQHDEPLLKYNTDDDRTIEPENYAPIVPMVLLNGAEGIGTGWSTYIPNYSPEDVVRNLKRRMGRLDVDEEQPFEPMIPWYKGWKGVIEESEPNRYKCNGILRETGENEVEITELPVRMWTDVFKEKLEEIIKGDKGPAFVKDYREFNDHQTVHFIITMDEKQMGKVTDEGLLEKFKLTKSIATSNLVAFDTRGQIRKYEKVEQILEEFYVYRLEMYHQRKKFQLEIMHDEYRKLTNQARFVTEIIEGKLVVSKKKKAVLVSELQKRKYEAFSKVAEAKKMGETAQVVENLEEEEEDDMDGKEDVGMRDYDYLLGMPIWNLTQERVDKLKENMIKKKQQYDDLEKLSEKDIWCIELDAFLDEWKIQLAEEADANLKVRKMGRRVSSKIGAGGKGKGRAKKVEEESYEPKAKKKAPAEKAPAPAKASKISTGQAKLTGMWGNAAKAKESFDGASSVNEDDDDEDFAGITAAKPSTSRSVSVSVQPDSLGAGRNKRAAAAKPKVWMDDSDEEASGDDLLGDINALVKGINKDSSEPVASSNTGRVSLHGMSRGSIGTSNQALKKKPSKASNFDGDDDDETNYELLAKSPQKSAPAKDELDSFLSDDESVAPVTKKASVSKPAPQPKQSALLELSDTDDNPFVDLPKTVGAAKPKAKAAPAAQKASRKVNSEVDEEKPAPKKRGRKPKKPVEDGDDDLPKKSAAKATKKDKPAPKKKEPAPAPKPMVRSPAAKAYAAKQVKAAAGAKTAAPAKKSKYALSDSEDEGVDMDRSEDEILAPKKKTVAPKDSDSDDDIIAPKKQEAPSKALDSDDDEEEEEDESESDVAPPKPKGRGRPARAAVVKKPVYTIDDSDDDDMDDAGGGGGGGRGQDEDESALVVDDDDGEEEEDSYDFE